MLDVTTLHAHRPSLSGLAAAPWERADDHLAERVNVASWLAWRASERPFQRALVQPEGYNHLHKRCYSALTFTQLDALCDAYIRGFRAQGIERGQRVLMLVSQGFELISVTFALFKMGAVPVMIDPGMGRKSFLACIEQSTPDAMVGIERAHLAKKLFGKSFKSIKRAFITNPVWWAGAPSLSAIARFEPDGEPCEDTHRDDLAAILFTSGSTGIPKGVHYTHGIFDEQVRAIGRMYGITPGEIEVPAFPLFSLFSIALGMTCVIPDMDPTKPAQVDPANIVEAILDHGATTAFGSPAVWGRVGPYCVEHGITLPTLKRILTAGAPVNPVLMAQFKHEILSPGVQLHTPYGATENLPLSTISSDEILEDTLELTRQGHGLCVGRVVHGMRAKIIAITDEVIPTMRDAEELPDGEVGEVCVTGVVTTTMYDRMPEKTRQAKIQDGDTTWHRMGDLGYFDEQGRLWYCGRKAHRVQRTPEDVMFSMMCEPIFNTHPAIFRSALVGLGEPGAKRPVIIIQSADPSDPPSAQQVLEIAQQHELTRHIKDVLFHPDFPVDRRHNAKIHREELAVWAATLIK